MGYVESVCQLCAVSFNIARVRTPHEPNSSGWGNVTPSSYPSDDGRDSRCSMFPEQSGCKNVKYVREGEEGVREREMHVAGEGCAFEQGYSGWRIGVKEMKGMNLPRYIVEKPLNLNAYLEEKQEAYERESDFFITPPVLRPVDNNEPREFKYKRFDVVDGRDFLPQNYDVMGDGRRFGIPVHDACWNIFEKVCERNLGNVDLQGLVALWWRRACGTCGFRGLKHDPIIRNIANDNWTHMPGTEYLATNPHKIPGFPVVMHEAYRETYNQHNGVFGSMFPADDSTRRDVALKRPAGAPLHVNESDPFMTLPTELLSSILKYLGSKEITNLRLVSRAFRQLPRVLFKRLIKEDMPWFFEIEEVEDQDRAYWKERLEGTYGKAESEELDQRLERTNEIYKSWVKARLRGEKQNVNWLTVYERLRVMEKGLFGVRNRVRIWRLVEDVVGMIGKLRGSVDEERYRPKGEGGKGVEPTDEEKAEDEANGYSCPRCQTVLIYRKVY